MKRQNRRRDTIVKKRRGFQKRTIASNDNYKIFIVLLHESFGTNGIFVENSCIDAKFVQAASIKLKASSRHKKKEQTHLLTVGSAFSKQKASLATISARRKVRSTVRSVDMRLLQATAALLLKSTPKPSHLPFYSALSFVVAKNLQIRSFAQRNSDKFYKNEQIPHATFKLIGPDGSKIGVRSLKETLNAFPPHTYDVLCVSNSPPVCKLLLKNIDKSLSKNIPSIKSAPHNRPINCSNSEPKQKEKTLLVGTAATDHDTKIKCDKLGKWLEKGMKVTVYIEKKGAIASQQSMEHVQSRVLELIKGRYELASKPKLVDDRRLMFVLQGLLQHTQKET